MKAGFIGAALANLRRRFLRCREYSQRRSLSKLDDHQLDDLGLSRDDAEKLEEGWGRDREDGHR